MIFVSLTLFYGLDFFYCLNYRIFYLSFNLLLLLKIIEDRNQMRMIFNYDGEIMKEFKMDDVKFMVEATFKIIISIIDLNLLT